MKNTSKNLLTVVFTVFIAMLSFSSVLAQNGNVGIGTTDPDASAILDLTSTNQGFLLPRLTQTQEDNLSGPTSLMIYNTNKGEFRYTVSDGTWRALNPWREYSSQDHVYYQNSATIGTLPSDFSHGLLVNSGDNKTLKLLSNNSNSGARMYFGDDEYVYIGEDNDDDLYFHAQDGHHFKTGGNETGNGTEKMTILENGNVGIGTSSPSEKLDVVGSAKISNQLFLGTNPTDYNNVGLQVGMPSGDNTAVWLNNNSAPDADDVSFPTLVLDNEGNGIGLYIVTGSAIKPGGGSWSGQSDRRLKQDIKNYSEGLAQVRAINTVTYRYNELADASSEDTYVGIIAQELQEIAPHMVKKQGEYLTVDPSAFTYMLINAVQEQDQIITDQQKEIDELKARLDRIEALLKK